MGRERGREGEKGGREREREKRREARETIDLYCAKCKVTNEEMQRCVIKPGSGCADSVKT